MATYCNHCKCLGEHFYWNHFETTRMHFGKAMDDDFSEHMIIPKKFVKNFREELSKTIQLKGPSSHIWHVRLLNIAGDMVMAIGWRQFVKDNYINKDDYLVFKYDGNSCFNVLIFDETGCEKASTYFVKNSMSKVNEPCPLEQEVAEDSLEFLRESLPPEDCECRSPRKSCDKRQQKPHFSATCNAPKVGVKIGNKKVSAASSHFKRQGRDDELSFVSVNSNDQMSRPTKAAKHSDKKKKESNSARRPFTEEEKARALRRANALRPTNPFFVKVLQVSHVSTKTFLNIPKSFAAMHVRSTQKTVLLRLPNGKKKWNATYSVYERGLGLSGQWRKFVLDNHLEKGDACVFELTRATEELVMVVHIFRVVEEVTPVKREA